MSSQLFAAARARPGVEAGLQAGDDAPLFEDLRAHVWSHGRSSTPQETLIRATGRALDIAPFAAEPAAKVDDPTAR